MQYTENFLVVKIKIFTGNFFYMFLIFAQNIDCGYTFEPRLAEAVLTSTHNLYFGAKIRKIGIHLHCYPVLLYIIVGFRGYILHGHVFVIRVFFLSEKPRTLQPFFTGTRKTLLSSLYMTCHSLYFIIIVYRYLLKGRCAAQTDFTS